MFNFKKKAYKEIVKDPSIPFDIHVYHERRNNVRISMLKTKVNLRLPIVFSASQREHYLQYAVEWTKKKLKQTPHASPQNDKVYKDGDVIHVYGMEFKVSISEVENRKMANAAIDNYKIEMTLPRYWSKEDKDKAARDMVRKLLCRQFQPVLENRVRQLNAQYFNKHINAVKLKYNVSNWGSCSKKCNVNLSLRLLFAPDHVIDYVIIHELSHLIEMNHSDRFWKVVEEIDPDYRSKEKWLKDNAHTSFV